MAETMIVTAPLVIVYDSNGKLQYVYQGGELPDGIDSDQVKRLKDRGLIGPVKVLVATEEGAATGPLGAPPAQILADTRPEENRAGRRR